MLIMLCCLLSFVLTGAHAAEKPTASHLKKVNTQIKLTKKALQQQQQRYLKLQQQLKAIELQQATTTKISQSTQKKLRRTQADIKTAHKKQQQAEQQLRSQLSVLNKQLRAYYKLGQQPGLKLLLNNSNMQKSNQLLYYYHYLNQSRAQSLKHINESLTALQKTQAQSEIKQHELESLQQQHQHVLQQLQKKQQQRHVILSALQKTIQSKQQHLQQLINDKRQLENALKKLSKSQPHAGQFSKQRGHLPWPTRGAHQHLYNKPIAGSQLTWSGELIRAKAGQKIIAVAPGKVVYSDWLRGFGLLLIINHGSGYMSLYARNQALYKKVGETVAAGALIALVGKSGGFNEAALYFELRHNGHPLNPNQWCQKT